MYSIMIHLVAPPFKGVITHSHYSLIIILWFTWWRHRLKARSHTVIIV